MAIALLAASAGAAAEDIDLFVGAESNSSTDYPNVIILLDNSSNWAAQSQQWPNGDAQGESELRAIKRVVESLDVDELGNAKVNIGLMMLNEGDGQIADGGYVRSRVMEMTAANRAEFIAKIDGILANFQDPTEKVSASVGYDRAMFEVFKYFGGHTSVADAYSDIEGGSQPRNSTHFGPYRYSGNAVLSKRDPGAFADVAQTIYNPAAPTAEVCKAKNYVILIGNGWPGPTESDAATLLRNVGEDPTQQIYPTSSSDVRYADEIARFMFQTDVSPATGFQNVITYAIDVYNAKPSAAHTRLLRSMSEENGGGKYFAANNEDQIALALGTALSEIKSVSSVFASVSLPVSVNTQGTYLNQVFVGMFRPDENALPRWAGNLKQYKMGMSGEELVLQDADNRAAINSTTGFVTECARSFWTPSTIENYWSAGTLPYWSNVREAKLGGCLAVSGSMSADYPDGNVVEKGAQAYKLRTGGTLLLADAATRNVLACTQSDCTTPPTPAVGLLDQFDADHGVTAAELDTTDEERTALINWARGANAGAESEFSNATGTSSSTVRPSVHGDVVHSRPVAINFGSDTSKQVVVFYGGNDGLLRAVNGNRDADGNIGTSGRGPGQELWSFMPPEFYPHIKRIRDNTIGISFPNFPDIEGAPDPEPKAYGFDGPVTAHKDSSDAWLYASMRRGGRALYAFDVDNPASPSLKWRVGCPSPDVASDTGCTTDFSDIGQTWSSAKPFLAQGYQAGAAPLLIMGGGYDVCEDFDDGTHNHDCSASSKGNQIYILDADTGDVVKAFETERGVVGDVTLVNGSNGMTQYAYAADLGGNVYRITIGEATEDNWGMTRIAALGCDSLLASCNANRKFMFAPDVVVDGNTYYVLVGSGDREKPLENNDNGVASAATAVANHFYMVRDIPSDSNWLSSERSTCSVPDGEPSVICLDSLYPIGATADSPTESVVNTKKGWYLELRDDEQVVTSAITVYGVVTFSTHIPEHYQPGQCPTLGTASVYNIDYTNAESENGTGLRFEEIAGGGLPPSPVAGMVTLDDGTTVPFVIGSNPESPLQGGEAPAPNVAGQPRAKVYWNVEEQQDPLP